MEIRNVEAADEPAVERFVARIPEGDRTFFKEDVNGTNVVAFWQRRGGITTVAIEDGEVVGYGAVIPLQGWSSHVGEVRVIVDPTARGHGVGRALARGAVLASLELGLTKLVVEVMADQEVTIAMFRSLGFDPEALLDGPRPGLLRRAARSDDPLPLRRGVVGVDAVHGNRRGPFRMTGSADKQRRMTQEETRCMHEW